MTEPSQYFKGRTVQEQMNEVIGYVDTRAAEVATAAIASDVAQVHQDMLDADADAQAAAASAAAAAGTLANAVKKTGETSQSIAGNIAVAGNLSGVVVTGTKVTVPTPVNNTDAANKKYVDDADALKINIADINSYAVGLTGNQTAYGDKGFDGKLKQYGGTPNIDFYNDSTEKQYWGSVGVRFRSVATTNVAIQSYAPKVDPDDPNEIRRGGFIQVISDQSGTVEIAAYAVNSSGSLVKKTLTYFNGNTWN